MEAITIRKANINDLETLLVFEQAMISAERPFDPTLKKGPNHYYDIEKMIDAPEVELVVAESGVEIVGCGYARIETSKHYLAHQKHSYLGFMYVKPEYRGKGVNKKIVGVLNQWALAQGLTEVRLEVYNENESAIRAYEKAGFQRHIIEMRMSI